MMQYSTRIEASKLQPTDILLIEADGPVKVTLTDANQSDDIVLAEWDGAKVVRSIELGDTTENAK